MENMDGTHTISSKEWIDLSALTRERGVLPAGVRVGIQTYKDIVTAATEFYRTDTTPVTWLHCVALMHIVYAWMPQQLYLGGRDTKKLVGGGYPSADTQKAILQITGDAPGHLSPTISMSEFDILKKVIGRSGVAVSKYLHCLNPRIYPIWDNRVRRSILKPGYKNELSTASANDYLLYAGTLHKWKTERDVIAEIALLRNHEELFEPATDIRLLEFILYYLG